MAVLLGEMNGRAAKAFEPAYAGALTGNPPSKAAADHPAANPPAATARRGPRGRRARATATPEAAPEVPATLEELSADPQAGDTLVSPREL